DFYWGGLCLGVKTRSPKTPRVSPACATSATSAPTVQIKTALKARTNKSIPERHRRPSRTRRRTRRK
ncbi:unnamed protein product, partial [Tenebrio molitor]